MNGNDDFSKVVENLSSMINNDNIPDSVKELLANLKSSGDSNADHSSNVSEALSGFSNNDSSYDSNGSNNPQIDMDTMLKIGKIISLMNDSKNDDRSNLLLSLKPYLRESKKNKLSQYIKLLNMSRALEFFNNDGGGLK